MKTNIFTTAFAAILGLAIIGMPVTAHAQSTTNSPAATPADTSTTAKVKEKKKSGKTNYEGSITAIDASSLTVASTKKTLTLAIAPGDQVRVQGGQEVHARQGQRLRGRRQGHRLLHDGCDGRPDGRLGPQARSRYQITFNPQRKKPPVARSAAFFVR